MLTIRTLDVRVIEGNFTTESHRSWDTTRRDAVRKKAEVLRPLFVLLQTTVWRLRGRYVDKDSRMLGVYADPDQDIPVLHFLCI